MPLVNPWQVHQCAQSWEEKMPYPKLCMQKCQSLVECHHVLPRTGITASRRPVRHLAIKLPYSFGPSDSSSQRFRYLFTYLIQCLPKLRTRRKKPKPLEQGLHTLENILVQWYSYNSPNFLGQTVFTFHIFTTAHKGNVTRDTSRNACKGSKQNYNEFPGNLSTKTFSLIHSFSHDLS